MADTRILYHLVAPLDLTIGPEELIRRQRFLQGVADAETRIEVRAPKAGRDSVESSWDAALIAPALVEGLRAGEAQGFNAGIIGCFSDPGHDAAREAVGMPVIGPGAAAVHMALQLGERFSIISPGQDDAGGSRAGCASRPTSLSTAQASARY